MMISNSMEPEVSESLTSEIMRTAIAYFAPDEVPQRQALVALIREAIRVTDENFGVEAAVAWAGGYSFPQDMLDDSLQCFRAAGYDFERMVRERLQLLAPDRLSKARVDELHEDNPERTLLYDLAEGMRVPLPAGFSPNGAGPAAALRGTYMRVHTAVDRMLGDVVQQRLAFILPKALAVDLIPNLHLSTAHWAVKKGKPSGRPIGDLSFVQGTPLNSPETTAEAAAFYGEIRHPTIESIVEMILHFWEKSKAEDPSVRWEDLRIWKMDLKGAYTLLSFRPEDAGLFAMEVTGDRVYLQVAGIFGWACTPAAFQVVTRAIKWELAQVLKGPADMYVDDLIGASFAADTESEKAMARSVCVSLLGSKAIADEKTESGTRLDIIGYALDLSERRVTISRKNFLNTLYGFLTVDLAAPMSLKTAQRLASWGSRYGKICRAMRPFCGALNRLTAGRTDRHATFLVSQEAKVAIRAWRAMLFLVRYDERRFSRTMESFGNDPPLYIVEFDASLKGAGILWYRRVRGTEVCVGGSAIDLRFLGFGEDSSYQNLSEYIGGILGLIGLIKLGIKGLNVEMRGDSISALTWAQTERCRGEIVTNASFVFTMLCIAYDLDVKVTTHISGADNHWCDVLSRLAETGDSIRDGMVRIGRGSVDILELEGCQYVRQLLESCSAAVKFAEEGDFISFWGNMRSSIREVHRGSNQHLPPHAPLSFA